MPDAQMIDYSLHLDHVYLPWYDDTIDIKSYHLMIQAVNVDICVDSKLPVGEGWNCSDSRPEARPVAHGKLPRPASGGGSRSGWRPSSLQRPRGLATQRRCHGLRRGGSPRRGPAVQGLAPRWLIFANKGCRRLWFRLDLAALRSPVSPARSRRGHWCWRRLVASPEPNGEIVTTR